MGHDGLPSPLGTGLVLAGAEEQPVAVLRVDALEELTQGLVAALPVAAFLRLGLRLRGLLPLRLRAVAGGDVVGAMPLAVFVQVAGFGGVQAGVARAAGIRAVPFTGARIYAYERRTGKISVMEL